MSYGQNTPAPIEEEPSTGASLQTIVTVFGLSLIGTVVGTALFGTDKQSERAFRLLPWLRTDHEPAASDEQLPRGEMY